MTMSFVGSTDYGLPQYDYHIGRDSVMHHTTFYVRRFLDYWKVVQPSPPRSNTIIGPSLVLLSANNLVVDHKTELRTYVATSGGHPVLYPLSRVTSRNSRCFLYVDSGMACCDG